MERVLERIPAAGASYSALLPGFSREQLDAALLALSRAGKITGTIGRFFLPGVSLAILAAMPSSTEVERELGRLPADEATVWCNGCRMRVTPEVFNRPTPGRRQWSNYRRCFDCRVKADLNHRRSASNAHSGD